MEQNNTQPPAEVVNEISNKATAVTDAESDRLRLLDQEYGRMISQLNGYKSGYIAGATEWAQWKVKFDEARKQSDELWKETKELLVQHQRLKERAERMEKALKELVVLKDRKDKEGDFIGYSKLKQAAWEDARKALAWKEGKEEFAGSKFESPVPGITLGCISPEARNLLDTIMEEWEKHYKNLKEMHGEKHDPTFYGFAYWLTRWSGLIQPALTNPTK